MANFVSKLPWQQGSVYVNFNKGVK